MINTEPGAGTYRFVVTGTEETFLNTAGIDSKCLFWVVLNAYQKLSEGFATFVRVGL